MDTVKCSWCGITRERNQMILERKSGIGGLLLGRYFCSNKCKMECHNSTQGQTSNNDTPGQNQSQTNTVEKERLEFEKQKYEDEKRERKEKETNEKSEQLKKEGKTLQSLWVRVKGFLDS